MKTYQKITEDQIIHIDPNRAPPVVLASSEEFVLFAQTSDAVVTP